MGLGLSRRSFLRVSAAASALSWSRIKSFASSGKSSAVAAPERRKEPGRLFSSGLEGSQWNTFQAAGYAKDVSGICYRTKAAGYFTCYVDKLYPCSGMPLGGIDTGALYLEPSGVLDYTSIFNHLTPIGGPLKPGNEDELNGPRFLRKRDKERTSGPKGQMICWVHVRAEARVWSFYISRDQAYGISTTVALFDAEFWLCIRARL